MPLKATHVSNVAVTHNVIKYCPLNKDENNTQQKRPYNHQNKVNHHSTPDNAIEPLTKLFNNLIEQLKQLNPAGNNSQNSHSH